MRCVDVTVRTQILTRARTLVAQGWTQSAFKVNHPREGAQYCLLGAVEQAAFESGFTQFRVQPWNALCRAFRIPQGEMLIDFNDAKSTTQEAVLEVLDAWIESGAQERELAERELVIA